MYIIAECLTEVIMIDYISGSNVMEVFFQSVICFGRAIRYHILVLLTYWNIK